MRTDLPDGTFMVDGRRFGVCVNCRQLIRADKFLFGSLHLCASKEQLHLNKCAREQFAMQVRGQKETVDMIQARQL